MKREDYDPIAATRGDLKGWLEYDWPMRVARLVRLALVYAIMPALVFRAVAWMLIVPAIESEFGDGDQTIDNLRIMRPLGKPVPGAGPQAELVARTLGGVFGAWMLLRVPLPSEGISNEVLVIGATVGPTATFALSVLNFGYLVCDPMLGAMHRYWRGDS